MSEVKQVASCKTENKSFASLISSIDAYNRAHGWIPPHLRTPEQQEAELKRSENARCDRCGEKGELDSGCSMCTDRYHSACLSKGDAMGGPLLRNGLCAVCLEDAVGGDDEEDDNDDDTE